MRLFIFPSFESFEKNKVSMRQVSSVVVEAAQPSELPSFGTRTIRSTPPPSRMGVPEVFVPPVEYYVKDKY